MYREVNYNLVKKSSFYCGVFYLRHYFQSNVRQTLACSLHEIAHVIGPEQTEQDLIHPFNNFIYDIDSVKIGLLKNLSKFLKVCPYCFDTLLSA